MRYRQRVWMVFLFLVLLIACTACAPASSKLSGAWVLDMAHTPEGAPTTQQGYTFTQEGDVHISLDGQDIPYGTYTLQGDSLTMHTPAFGDLTYTFSIQEDILTLTNPEGLTENFQKK